MSQNNAASKAETREVEVYRCWDDHTWDAEFVTIPADTPEDRLQEVAEHQALEDLRHSADLPYIIGIYSASEEEESGEDG